MAGYTSLGPGDPEYDAYVADPGALAAAAMAAGQPGTENLDQPNNSWLSAASSPALVKALQDASKSSMFNPQQPPALGAAAIPRVATGSPSRFPAERLNQLVQLLNKQQAQYTLSGQPVAQPRQLGLLGF
jgi:hypothetical protein